MKDKSLSKNNTNSTNNKTNIEIIHENMNKIKDLNDWDYKIILIKETKELIQNEKINLNNMKNKIDEELEEQLEFGKLDLKKVIEKIHKNKNLEDKIEKLRLLKLWFKHQKDKVINT
ncbi:hypothetical protein crov052 [Cafeteria roenbergensis virus]|uniref:Uncharacterized protein n=1 Tax=Cafeteria roenbergensis virus (strain BV-PW1) TaxID=693272 RepID=E3T4H2_CROVB|nr:hypothetical protein crov052 [Cafeteria roenbergensis virus BV-PW1]ADO67085.1 hypothetical protein crov052 [Cafeteria roenbergensis virus BV-PW1]